MVKDKKREEAEQLYLQLQLLDNQLQQIQQELTNIESKQQELLALKESLGVFGKLKKSSRAMAQIGMGIYAESKIESNKELLVNVGAQVYVKKKIEEVGALIEKQIKELKKAEQELIKSAQILSLQAHLIQAQLQKTLGVK